MNLLEAEIISFVFLYVFRYISFSENHRIAIPLGDMSFTEGLESVTNSSLVMNAT